MYPDQFETRTVFHLTSDRRNTYHETRGRPMYRVLVEDLIPYCSLVVGTLARAVGELTVCSNGHSQLRISERRSSISGLVIGTSFHHSPIRHRRCQSYLATPLGLASVGDQASTAVVGPAAAGSTGTMVTTATAAAIAWTLRDVSEYSHCASRPLRIVVKGSEPALAD